MVTNCFSSVSPRHQTSTTPHDTVHWCVGSGSAVRTRGGEERERKKERETERETERDRERQRERQREKRERREKRKGKRTRKRKRKIKRKRKKKKEREKERHDTTRHDTTRWKHSMSPDESQEASTDICATHKCNRLVRIAPLLKRYVPGVWR